MGVIRDKLGEGRCRVESGIFFSNDEVILLTGDPRSGYAATPRVSVSTLIEKEVDGWTEMDVNPSCRIEKDGLAVWAGSTGWEGEGFIAVAEVSSGELLWLLHLNESEAFTRVALESERVGATSSEYPHRYEWYIPLKQPEELRVIAFRAG